MKIDHGLVTIPFISSYKGALAWELSRICYKSPCLHPRASPCENPRGPSTKKFRIRAPPPLLSYLFMLIMGCAILCWNISQCSLASFFLAKKVF